VGTLEPNRSLGVDRTVKRDIARRLIRGFVSLVGGTILAVAIAIILLPLHPSESWRVRDSGVLTLLQIATGACVFAAWLYALLEAVTPTPRRMSLPRARLLRRR